jgi:hypothetical protein
VSDAIKTAEELEPAVQAFAEATGLLTPIQELALWATDLIRYRRAPHQAKLLTRAAEKVRATGLPPSAVSDKLLRAALEDGAMEDDPEMQERWINLLANAGTRPTTVHAAFPRMLSELESNDARVLEQIAAACSTPGRALRAGPDPDWVALENLGRLGLVTNTHETALNDGEIQITGLGQVFLLACQDPSLLD